MNLIKKMLKEEWRMHSSVFGSYKFAFFPLVVFLLALVIFYSFPFLGFKDFEVQLGMHWIIFFLGLNVGTLGFVSRGGMRNVLGEMNLLLFSSRTLPVSRKSILANFLVKDIIYYFFYLILPLVLGNLVFLSSLTSLVTITVSYSLAFILGLGTTFFLTVMYRIFNKIVVGIASLCVILSLYFLDLSLSSFPPYKIYASLSAQNLFITTGTIGVFLVLGILLFQKKRNVKSKGRNDLFTKLSARFGALNAKNIVDLQRSSGGLGKIFFSFAILFVFVWFLLTKFPFGNILFTRPLMVLAVLFGVFPVSIYNWLNRYDSEKNYLHLPLEKDDLITGKVRSYLVLGPASVVTADILAYLVFGGTLFELVHAVVTSTVISLAVLAILTEITELDPNTKLFDATVFGKFLVLSAAVMLPFLIVSLLYLPGLQESIFLLSLYGIVGVPTYGVLRTKLKKD